MWRVKLLPLQFWKIAAPLGQNQKFDFFKIFWWNGGLDNLAMLLCKIFYFMFMFCIETVIKMFKSISIKKGLNLGSKVWITQNDVK